MTLAKIFRDGMLLQRDIPTAIWGTARPGEVIRITVQNRSAAAIADASGAWLAHLPPLCASKGETLTVRGADGEIALHDVAVGEVFIASGQSNMEFHMRDDAHYSDALASCGNPDIRFYEVPKVAYDGQPPEDPDAGVWRKASPQELEYFSAAGYYFARKLAGDLAVPMGIVGCYWGGTRSCAWMNEAHARRVLPEQCAADTTECPQNAPGALFENMVLPISPFAARGVLWYQGESDDDFPQHRYAEALQNVMFCWRFLWRNPDLPFLVVQLPGFDRQFDAASRDYVTIRRCQQQAVDGDDRAWLCSISDAGEEFDIHPKDKRPVGERLALLAERHLLGMDILADAPRCEGVEREGDRISITFENAGGGLRVAGDALQALDIRAGERAVSYTWEVEGNVLRIQLDGSEAGDVRVRFAQTNWYCVNLYNEAGIPAIPFEGTV